MDGPQEPVKFWGVCVRSAYFMIQECSSFKIHNPIAIFTGDDVDYRVASQTDIIMK